MMSALQVSRELREDENGHLVPHYINYSRELANTIPIPPSDLARLCDALRARCEKIRRMLLTKGANFARESNSKQISIPQIFLKKKKTPFSSQTRVAPPPGSGPTSRTSTRA